MPNAIQIENLEKSFGKVVALNSISFKVKNAEIFGFLGPNGAGKTTTIRLMMDFIRPSSGKISIFDQDSQQFSVGLKKMIGYLPSDNQLYENWTGNDHIKFSEKLNGKSELTNDLINKLDYNPKLRVKHLSTGNKKKLALILTLMHQPKLLILDEPTNGLDPLLQNTFYKIIKEFQAKGITIFMSSHNLPEIENVCDRVGIIKNGKMVAIESIARLRSKHIYSAIIHFKDKINPAQLEEKNIQLISSNNKTVHLQIKGDINNLLSKISKLKVLNIQIEPASLEDIFLEFYK